MVQQNFFDSLPHNLIIDILVRVAAHSFKDFINVTLCCREWNELGEDDYILKHLSLHEFKEWNLTAPESEEYKRKSKWLVNKCADAGNVEALYRKGLVDYVGGEEAEKVLQWLNDAAYEGHVGAEYAAAVISTFGGWESGNRRLKAIMQCKEFRKVIPNAHMQLVFTCIKAAGDHGLRTLPVIKLSDGRWCTVSDHELRWYKGGFLSDAYDEEAEEVECLSCICDSQILNFLACLAISSPER